MLGKQARPAQAGRPTGSGGITSPDEVQALLVEIFDHTGQKVQADDPLVAAALIHSALLRRAGADAARAIEKAAQNSSPPLDDDARDALRWLGLWHTQVMLGTVLFVICFLASALGTLLATSACR